MAGTYRGIVPDAFLDAIDIQVWTDRRLGEMADASLGLLPHVAEIEDEVVGWAMGGPNLEPSLHFSGELYAIYLLPERRRQGIGLNLVRATAAGLMGLGLDSMVVWVLAENRSARRFYEALGARYVTERHVQIGGAFLPEVTYGWSDIGALVGMRM